MVYAVAVCHVNTKMLWATNEMENQPGTLVTGWFSISFMTWLSLGVNSITVCKSKPSFFSFYLTVSVNQL